MMDVFKVGDYVRHKGTNPGPGGYYRIDRIELAIDVGSGLEPANNFELIPNLWYSVDFSKSDNATHVFCKECFEKIPDFLIRYSIGSQYWQTRNDIDSRCEGCRQELNPR